MIEKIPHIIGNQIFLLKCGFGIGYNISRKYRPISVSVLDLNQNSGFGRTLPEDVISVARTNSLKLIVPLLSGSKM